MTVIMSDLWIVMLDAGGDPIVYGPFGDEETAKDFARFLSAEVAPATVQRLRSPMHELLAARRAGLHIGENGRPTGFPDHWPPKHGDIWQDQKLDRWSCQQDGSLACLAHRADDAPYEINRVFGPMTLVYRPDASEKEIPF